MNRIGARIAMAAVGIALLVVYLAGAWLCWWALSTLWRGRVDPLLTVGGVLAVTLFFAYLSYRFGTERLLSELDAVEIPPSRAPELYRLLDGLCERMDLRRPRLLVTRMEDPNALAVGGRNVIVLDRHLLNVLERDELEGILAHELAHVESRDALVGTMAYSTLRALVGVALVALFPAILLVSGLGKAVGWIAGRPSRWTETLPGRVHGRIERAVAVVLSAITLLFLAHSRRREYAADDRAVEVTGRPLALARGLAKIDRAARSPWDLLSMLRITAQRDEERRRLGRMLSTHPPIEERIERLVERADRDARLRPRPLEAPIGR